MKYIFSIFVIAGMLTAVDAQRYRNPDQYLREFSNESRKINIKNQLYLEALLRGEEGRRVEKYRELVLEQLQDSKRDLERVGKYEDYEILQREYVKGLDQFIEAYDKGFGKVEKLRDSAYTSYENLIGYFDALEQAETKMYDASYKLEKAEDHFAKTYYVEVRRQEELEEKYKVLDEVSVYVRDMTKAFFRVHIQSENLLRAIENDNMDTLSMVITDLRNAIRESEKQVAEYVDFEGEDDLYEEVRYILNEVNEEINDNLNPAVEVLANRFSDPDDVEDARKDIQYFKRRHEGREQDFYDARADVLEEYLPED